MVPIIALIVFLGVYPKPLLDRIEPSVKELVTHMEQSNPGYREPQTPVPAARATESEAGGEHGESPAGEAPAEAGGH